VVILEAGIVKTTNKKLSTILTIGVTLIVIFVFRFDILWNIEYFILNKGISKSIKLQTHEKDQGIKNILSNFQTISKNTLLNKNFKSAEFCYLYGTFSEHQNNYEEAKKYYEKALKQYHENEYSIKILSSICVLSYENKEKSRANLTIQKILSKINQLNSKQQLLYLQNLNLIFMTASLYEDYNNATMVANRMLEIYTKNSLPDDLQKAYLFKILADNQLKNYKLKESKDNYLKALKIFNNYPNVANLVNDINSKLALINKSKGI
jgi:tetratricopeptide (TPR) repeat protein